MTDAEQKPAEAPPLPPPSAALIIVGSLVRAHLRRIPKSERRAFLRDVTDDLRWQAEMAAVLRIRPASTDEEVAEARREAEAWWVQMLGVLMMQLDR